MSRWASLALTCFVQQVIDQTVHRTTYLLCGPEPGQDPAVKPAFHRRGKCGQCILSMLIHLDVPHDEAAYPRQCVLQQQLFNAVVANQLMTTALSQLVAIHSEVRRKITRMPCIRWEFRLSVATVPFAML